MPGPRPLDLIGAVQTAHLEKCGFGAVDLALRSLAKLSRHGSKTPIPARAHSSSCSLL
jgi:hypothetical protein